MTTIKYLTFHEINPNEFIPLLNSQKIREHLIDHTLFDLDSIKAWTDSKIEVNSSDGCRVRAIVCNNHLAGWCGIQEEDDKYEFAIVIDEQFWGLGKTVFQEMMRWAKELGHDEVFIHFLHTRSDYKFLQNIAKNVYKTKMLGSQFTTYQLTVS